MQAAVLRQTGQRMEIEDISIAKPQGREVLVRLQAVGVCHSDLHIINGDFPHPLPAVLGHEAAGIVEQVGPEVRHLKPGDRVIVCLTFHCGHCEQCDSGNTHRCYPAEANRAGIIPRLCRDYCGVIQPLRVGRRYWRRGYGNGYTGCGAEKRQTQFGKAKAFHGVDYTGFTLDAPRPRVDARLGTVLYSRLGNAVRSENGQRRNLPAGRTARENSHVPSL